ncbi:MAG: murein biosynthesis integral membrane protein MurJ [Candidatus Nealsonbacteria bacterium]|nr:murein biosynthesis integral membrane protein MurJ [Candidatus Nealsonbacteria bacterium]
MTGPKRHPLITGARITALGTLASRLLGMVRDVSTAWLLGMRSGGVMDAFAIAFRIPNLFRRLFGEGALTASYLPVLSAELERDRRTAWRLASVTLTWLVVLLSGLVVLGEGVFALIWLVWGDVPGIALLTGLAAVMLPYLLLVCLAAQLTATLHALSHFSVPAFAPVLLNVCWLAAALLVAPRFTGDKEAQAYVLATAILISGVLQVGVQVPVLRRLGFRFQYDWAAAREGIGKIARAMAPTLVGLAVTQINTLIDSLIAWGLATSSRVPEPIPWLGGKVCYPLQEGAAAAIYYGERFYQFPLGVLGLAVAVAIFPLLSRHAARGDRDLLGADLTLGLRLVVCLGIPAGVGLIVLAEPLAKLLLQHGEFNADDTLRTARMITCYGLGVWAFCALPVVVRGFYALGDCGTPAKLAGWVVGLNLALNLSLIWTPLAEAGLAVATSISAMVQVVVLVLIFSRGKSPLGWAVLGTTAARTIGATLLMAAAALGALELVHPLDGFTGDLARVLLPLAAGIAVYAAAYRLLGGRELGLLLHGVDKS